MSKRKWSSMLSTVIIAGLVLSTTPLSAMAIPTYAMGKTYQGNLTPEAATAYTAVLENDIYDKGGITPIGYWGTGHSPFDVFRVCTLIDFEQDNQPELFVIYPRSDDSGEDRCEVWGLRNGSAVNLATQNLKLSAQYGLTKVDGRTYFVNTVVGDLVECYSIQKGAWGLAKSFVRPLAEGEPWKVDGKTVSSSVYQKTYQHWFAAMEVVSDDIREEINHTYQQLSPRRAKPTTAKLRFDGKMISLDAYAINGRNYYKLRDIAMLLVGTSKEAQVGHNGLGVTIGDERGAQGKYTPVGGELALGGTKEQIAYRDILINQSVHSFRTVTDAYAFNGYNYFAIRDLGLLFNFEVSWEGSSNTIDIDSSKGYTAE